MARSRPPGSVQEALGALTIGEGYLVRGDGVAVALIDLTPPDLRLHDATSLARLLEAATHVFSTCPDRCSLLTMAVPLDYAPLIQTLTAAQQRAPDFRSYAILGALTDALQHAWAALGQLRTVRWVIAVPSVAPETPPSGMWGELRPAALVGQVTRLPGDPVTEALTRARRLAGQFATLGLEPAPTLMSAPAIRRMLRAALDPVAAESQQALTAVAAPRPLQVVAPEVSHATR
ncbi:hypothetical protein [Candidatus Chloroploca sp. Khr17]|uniref:hypothetical protein n=1 Tax=Candidatus Chloroploca sp. Khr17 TaxID=2496869 RepID=UPI00101B5F05|nr:hypothetical protein [Candidatus Chloroploca sp. Khr17]